MSLTANRAEQLIAKALNQQHDGNWIFNHQVGWWEDDKDRMILLVGVVDDAITNKNSYYMYGDGEPKCVGYRITTKLTKHSTI